MNILIVTAHPKDSGHTHIIAETYKQEAESHGHIVEIIDLYDESYAMEFVTLKKPQGKTKRIIELMQNKITWAHELVFVHPVWWGTIPAIMKNWIDSIFAPRFAYKYEPNGGHTKLLKGKTAKVFATSGGPAWIYYLPIMPLWTMWKVAVLPFFGVEVIDYKVCGNMNINNGLPAPGCVECFLEKVKKSARKIH